MHFQFLIEDMSGGILVEKVMGKILEKFPEKAPDITYDLKTFHGIGGFKKNGKTNTVKTVKTDKLLNDLPIFLRGFNKSLAGLGRNATLVIVLDNDQNDVNTFKETLEKKAAECMITIDHVFCIAVEEMESWLLGDHNAIWEAYPGARQSAWSEYVQDSICGTWEKLASVVYPGGITQLRKNCRTYRDIGKLKCEWARNIGANMDIYNNRSPSFCHFVKAIESRIKS